MHGRIKVITTEEQRIRQLKARKEKVDLYFHQFGEISNGRNVEGSTDEVMKHTRDLLLSNPDILTLWNIRRDILMSKKDNMEIGAFQELMQNELPITQQCLLVNPKSYCAWHHRLWCLDLLPQQFWNKELNICDLYLLKDERNFHVWNYRKIVSDKVNVSMLEELEFTMKKLEANFSNYSAWHYRSKILPFVYPDPEGNLPINKECLKQELEIVQSAVYTDPSDQSAWFYQRWLLGLNVSPLCIVGAGIIENAVFVAFSKNVELGKTYILNACTENKKLDDKWLPYAKNNKTSKIWTLQRREPVNELSLKLLEVDELSLSVVDEVNTSVSSSFYRPYVLPVLSEMSRSMLTSELEEMMELLSMENDNKSILLALIDLMKALDINLYFQRICEYLEKLKMIDIPRKHFYEDLMSETRIEYELIANFAISTFALPNANLTCLYHAQYFLFIEIVDFSNNKLKSKDLRNLYTLVSCRKLDLSNNCITNFNHFPALMNLSTLIASENPLLNSECDKKFLSTHLNLASISL